MNIIITEGQLKRIILEQTKPAPVKPKNQTFTTTQDRILTKDTLTGGQIKIPKGTRFTAHQDNFGPTTKYTVSVDRVEDGKIKPSTIFYCNSTNAGKFWNGASKSWYYDKTKALSGYLSKNLCTKSYGDKYYWENSAKWAEQKQQKKEDAWALENSPYVDATGKKVMYYKSTEFKKNYDFLKSQGLNVDGIMGSSMPRPNSPNHQFNLAALFSIKDITNFQADKVGWNNKECMSIGLSSLGNVKMKSKLFNTYDTALKSLIDDPKSRLYTLFSNTVSPSYANFFLSDFYFQFGKLSNDVNASQNVNNTVYFPDGVYNFMATYYGTTNVSQIKNTIQSKKAGCQGGGMTAEQGHKVISTLTFISAFIPFVGPFIAAGLGTADAAILWSQGKKGEAALTAGLSLIPFASEIPGLKGVGQEVFKSIASKTIGKIPLNASEISVVNQISAAKGEFDGIAKKWITNNSSNPLVKEFTNIAKEKGEEALIAKVKEKSGVNKYVPLTKKDAISIAKDATKDTAKELVKKYDA